MADALSNEMQVAVIGMAGRFPGAATVHALWQSLRAGATGIATFAKESDEPWPLQPDLLGNPSFVRSKARLEGVDEFDAAFFGYSAREAEAMDPQMRIFHEVAWEALEDAGHDPTRAGAKIGVFAGASPNVYWHALSLLARSGSAGESFAALAFADADYMHSQLAYKLNLTGPCMTVDTACSTSLVAIHMAVRAILTGECAIALAGGASVPVPSPNGYLYEPGMILSPDGQCRPFDERAAGTVPGQGVAVVVLKQLRRALADGDCVRAVIRGSAINNDGHRKIGYTAPSIDGQRDVVRAAQRAARVAPESITYIEAHGTATSLGDPIEVEALKAAFDTKERGFCGIGSIKSNLGHLDAAAGAAGLIKAVLSLEHRELPPTLHFKKANPKIDFGSSPFYVVDRLTAWETDRVPRRAGVSSFGIGGTNAHVIVEEAPSRDAEGESSYPAQALLLSAKTTTAVTAMAARLRDHLRAHPDVSLKDVAYTLQVGRAQLPHRRVLTCRTLADAIAELESDVPPLQAQEQAPALSWLFPGQGSQYANMARGLYEVEPHFRATMTSCFELASKLGRAELRELLFPLEAQADSEALHETEYGQPALFVLEYALAELLSHWGQSPRGMFGHSLGEFVAACVAGVMSLEDALRLVIARGRLMQKTAPGAMLGVAMSWESLRGRLGSGVSLAAHNAPEQCVLSGAIDAVSALEKELQAAGVKCRLLKTKQAFHSELMDPVLHEFAEAVRSVRLKAPERRYVSSLTGNWAGDEVSKVEYWVRQLREPVQAAAALGLLLEDPASVLVEAGPGNELCTFARHVAGRGQRRGIVNLLRHPRDDKEDWQHLLGQLGRLWQEGVSVPWQAVTANERDRRRVSLPTYPFERKRFFELLEPSRGLTLGVGGPSAIAVRDPGAPSVYVQTWQRMPEPGVAARVPQSDAAYLVLHDSELGSAIAATLGESSAHVVLARFGTGHERLADSFAVIDPSRQEDYDGLVSDFERAHDRIGGVVYVCGADGAADYRRLLSLARALSRARAQSLHLTIVTDALFDVDGHEEVDPLRALVLGPAKVVSEEYPRVTCSVVDLALGGGDARLVVDAVRGEVLTPHAGAIVAVRGRHRWLQTQERYELSLKESPLRSGGTYLITGGLGGIGLQLAGALARQHPMNLVLVARRALPERNAWEKWVAEHGEDEATSQVIREVVRVEALGATVLVLQADVADRGAMARALAEAKRCFGKLDGVLHCAGVADGALIQARSPESDEQVFAAKVNGTLVLDELLGDSRLDFVVLFSALATVLPPAGHVAYVAANAFLDAFAAWKHARGAGRTPWLSMAWDTWNRVGMAVDAEKILSHRIASEEYRKLLAEDLARGFSPDEACDLFVRMLSESLPHALAVKGDLAARRQRHREHSLRSVVEAAVAPAPSTSSRAELELLLANECSKFLGLDSIGAHDNWFELGATSLDIVQLTAHLNRTFSFQISAPQMFTFPTPHALAEFLSPDADSEREATRDAEEERRHEALSTGRARLAARRNKVKGE